MRLEEDYNYERTIKKVTEGQNLTREEAAKAMDMMLEGTASPVLVSAF